MKIGNMVRALRGNYGLPTYAKPGDVGVIVGIEPCANLPSYTTYDVLFSAYREKMYEDEIEVIS